MRSAIIRNLLMRDSYQPGCINFIGLSSAQDHAQCTNNKKRDYHPIDYHRHRSKINNRDSMKKMVKYYQYDVRKRICIECICVITEHFVLKKQTNV